MSKILRIKDVKDRTGLSRQTIYRLMKDNSFPHSILLSGLESCPRRMVGWVESEVEEWIQNRINGSRLSS